MTEYIPKYDETEEIKEEIPTYEGTTPLEGQGKQIGTLEAGNAAIGQGMTFGLGDEILAGVNSVKDLAGEGADDVSGTILKANPLMASKTLGNALLNLISGKKSLSDVPASYKKYRDAAREDWRLAQEQHPTLTTVGQIAGGVAAPGLGTAKLMGMVPKLAKGASVGAKLANIGTKATAGAASGAVQGGAFGFGNSEGETPEELAAATLDGTKTGAVIGGAIPVGVGGLGLGADAVKAAGGRMAKGMRHVPSLDFIFRNRDAGLKGVNTGDFKAQADAMLNVAEQLGESGVALKKRLQSMYDTLLNGADNIDIEQFNDEMGAIAKEADALTRDPSIKADIARVMGNIRGFIGQKPDALPDMANVAATRDALVQKIQSIRNAPEHALGIPYGHGTVGAELELLEQQLAKLDETLQAAEVQAAQVGPKGPEYSTNLSARDVKGMQSDMQNLGFNPQSPIAGSFPAVGVARSAHKGLGEVLEDQIPGMGDLNSKYRGVKNALDELGIAADSFTPDTLTNDLDLKTNIIKRIQNMIETSAKDGKNGNVVKLQIERILNNLEHAGMDVASLRSSIPEVAENYQLADSLNRLRSGGVNWRRPESIVSSLAGGLVSGSARAANFIGRQEAKLANTTTNLPGIAGVENAAMKGAVAAFDKPEILSQNAYELDDNALQTFSEGLIQDPALAHYGESLQRALASRNHQSKNSLIFSLLQKKEGREAFKKHLGN